MEKVKTEMKRNSLVDANTGRVDLRYNPLSLEEDYFIPMRGGVGSDITSLPGAKSLDDIDDVKYLRDKMFSALKVPQSYLTNLEGDSEDKTTLAQKDIRFARTIQRLQRSIVSELEKIAVVHLYTLGFRGDDLIGFDIKLNNPSRLAELQQLEYLRTKFDVANAVPEGTYSKRWVGQNILGLSDEEILRNNRETFFDRKLQQALESVVGDAAGADGGLGDLGGGDALGDLGGGDDALGDLGGEGDEGGEEDSALLTTPARKEDLEEAGPKRHYAKGSYRKVAADGRKSTGRTRRETKNAVKSEVAGLSTPRARNPGRMRPRDLAIGNMELKSMLGLDEKKEPIYNNESRLIENTNEVRRLVEQLEAKEAQKDET
jgi:hypothetical protein